MDFHARKLAALQAMASPFPDKSRKGDVDARIAPLIARINAHPAYFTTSSCSGRISISTSPSSSSPEGLDASEHTDEKEEEGSKKKKKKTKKKMKGGGWSFITHDPADADEVVRTVVGSFTEKNQGKKELLGNMVFRLEPFILAVECLDLAAAQAIVSCAISSGFRESGITSIKRRIIAAVRCSIRIETPIAEKGCLLINEEYLKFLVHAANEKMLANHCKTDKFFTEFITQIEVPYTEGNTSSFLEQLSSRDLSHKCRSKASESGKHNSRKLAELEKRQLTVLSRICDMEARVKQCVLQVSGLTNDANNKSEVVQEMAAVVKETQEYDATVEMIAAEDADLSTSSQDSGLDVEGRLAKAMFSKLNDSSEKLYRWGHSTCLLPGPSGTSSSLLLTFGGYGGYGKQCRQNDLVILDCLSDKLHSVSAKNPPIARIGHTASLIGQRMVVIGGREDPSKPLADVCILQLDKMEWIYPEIGGALFPPRHRHAAASIREKIYVFGGLCNLDVLGDLYVLDLSKLKWSRLECFGDVPTPRHSHSLSVIDEKLYLFGGFDGRTICGDLFVLEINSFIWSKINCDRIYRFSHSMTVVDRSLLLLGGCPLTKHVNIVSLLNVDSMQWSHRRVIFPIGSILVRHTATCLGKQVAIVGGGVSCYAFGIKFSPSILMDLTFLPNHTLNLEKQPDCLASRTSSSECVWGLKVDKHLAKLTKDSLKQLGWLDMRNKVSADEDGYITFPLRKAAESCVKGSSKRAACAEGCATSEKPVKEALFLTEISQNSQIVQMQSYIDTKLKKTPWERLLSSMRLLIEMHNLPESLLLDLPKRWERLDDMVVLPETAFRSEAWQSVGEQLWTTIAECLNVQRVARQARVKANDTRDSNLELLLGEDGWVHHRENGLLYCFDTTKCMFSSGNISEKLRMAGMECIGETVVDLFAGIGYFVLPFLKANAKKVFACEWNPFALNALRYNLHVNNVEDRCIVLEGDNKVTAPKGVAHRVCLGLLPSSEESWEVAVQALRPEGGVLHIHGNVKDTEEKTWVSHVHSSISNLSKRQGHSWDIRITHVEKVKWYAPHIRHLVADVECKAK